MKDEGTLPSTTVKCTPMACFSISALPSSMPTNLNLSNGAGECSSICKVIATVKVTVTVWVESNRSNFDHFLNVCRGIIKLLILFWKYTKLESTFVLTHAVQNTHLRGNAVGLAEFEHSVGRQEGVIEQKFEPVARETTRVDTRLTDELDFEG